MKFVGGYIMLGLHVTLPVAPEIRCKASGWLTLPTTTQEQRRVGPLHLTLDKTSNIGVLKKLRGPQICIRDALRKHWRSL